MDTEEPSRMKLNKKQSVTSVYLIGVSDLKKDLSGLKSAFPKLKTLKYKSLETYILNYLMDS